VRINPKNAIAVGNRAFVRLKLGDVDQSILDYDAAINLNPKFAAALYGRGLAKQKKGDRAGADADVAAAKALRPDIAEEFAKFGVD
jgi:tetratricopeptide (TPR) repeat protein